MAYLYPWSYCLVEAGFTQTNGKQWELTSQCCSALKVFCVWQHQNRKNQTFFVSQLKLKIDFLKQPYVRGVTFFQTMILDIHVDFPIIFDIYVKFLGRLSTEPKCLPFIHSWICGSYRILWCFCLSDFQSDQSVLLQVPFMLVFRWHTVDLFQKILHHLKCI